MARKITVHQKNDNAQSYMPWQPGHFKKARRHRMRLAWSVWLVAALFVLFQFFLQLSSGEIIAGLMRSFALTAFGGGLLASSYYYIYVLLQTPAGMLMDRYGPRGILSVGAVVVSVGCVVFCSAKTVFLAFIGRVLMGGGSAFAFVGCLSVISIWFPVKRFALMAAIVETAGMIGAIVGNFLLARCLQILGWRHCLIFAGLFAAILSVFLFAIVRNAPNRKRKSVVTLVRTSLWHGLKKLLFNPLVWVNGIYSGLMFGVVTVFAALWAIPFLETVYHLTLLQATLLISVLYVGVAIGGPIIGWIDGKTRYRKPMMVFNALCVSLLLLVVIFTTTLSLVTIAFVLFFTGVCASSYVLTFAIANELASHNSATAIGFTNMLCVIFAPILQPIIGFLLTHLHSGTTVEHWQWAMSVMPFLLMGGGVMALWLPTK